MKRDFVITIFGLNLLLFGIVNSCKKDSPDPPGYTAVTSSFTEEFDSVYQLPEKGWVIKDNSPVDNSGPFALWSQGYAGYFDKGGNWFGFAAYSYTHTPDEYCYSRVTVNAVHPISSWLLTPVLSVKNGDKISFYTRGDTAVIHSGRMQVLLNKSGSEDVGAKANTVGSFATLLFDINAAEVPGNYPLIWTKYEHVFTGIAGKMDTRIAFRHYVTNGQLARGIGIDLFSFQVN